MMWVDEVICSTAMTDTWRYSSFHIGGLLCLIRILLVDSVLEVAAVAKKQLSLLMFHPLYFISLRRSGP
jgi:hypothetical protein